MVRERNGRKSMILTVDVGGTNTKFALIDDKLNFIEKGKIPSVTTSLEEFIESIGQIYDRYQSLIEGVAFSMPGVVNPKTGYFYTGGAFDEFIHEINLNDVLSKRIPLPLSFANDAKCAASAELGYGVLKDVKDAVVVVFGTAIGGAIILDHKVVLGKHFSAGEFSYMSTTYEVDDFQHSWAYRNGAEGLLRMVQENLHTDRFFTGEEIFEMANQNNQLVLAAVRQCCKEIGYKLYDLQACFDPEVFAIGGGICEQPLIYQFMNESFDEIQQSYGYLLTRPKLVKCKYGNDANLLGALYHFNQLYGKKTQE